MPAWPSTIPQYFQRDGFEETPGNDTIRSPNSIGPDKVRRRTTANPEEIKGFIYMDQTEYTTFKAFYKDDLGRGSLSFTWVDPIDRSAATFRFMEKYKTAAAGAGFLVAIKLEKLP